MFGNGGKYNVGIDYVTSGERAKLENHNEDYSANYGPIINNFVGKVRIFVHEGIEYVELIEGEDGKFEIPMGNKKEKEKKIIGSYAELYQKCRANTFLCKGTKNKKDITRGGNPVFEEFHIELHDSDEIEGVNYEQNNHIYIHQTILSSKRIEGLLSKDGVEVKDKIDNVTRIIKAIPLKEYNKFIVEKQKGYLESANENHSLLESYSFDYRTKEHRKKISDRAFDILNIRLSKKADLDTSSMTFRALLKKIYDDLSYTGPHYEMHYIRVDRLLKYSTFINNYLGKSTKIGLDGLLYLFNREKYPEKKRPIDINQHEKNLKYIENFKERLKRKIEIHFEEIIINN